MSACAVPLLRRKLDLLRAFSEHDRPFMVTKEAVGALAALGLPEAETLLIERLGEFERAFVRGTSDYSPEETAEILDRTCAALAGRGSVDSARAVARHASLRDPRLGDTFGRLRHLAGTDLSNDPGLGGWLLETLQRSLPARVLGVAVGGRASETEALLAALSGSPDPRVVSLFEEIATVTRGGLSPKWPSRPSASSHPLYMNNGSAADFLSFDEMIVNKDVQNATRAVNPPDGIKKAYRGDSYILISAGKDGLYGTSDDIFNFDKGTEQ